MKADLQFEIERLIDAKLVKLAKTLCELIPEKKYVISKIFSDVSHSGFDQLPETTSRLVGPETGKLREWLVANFASRYESPFQSPENIHDCYYTGKTPFGYVSPIGDPDPEFNEDVYDALKERNNVPTSSFDMVKGESASALGRDLTRKSCTHVVTPEEMAHVPSFVFGMTDEERAERDRKAETGELQREMEEKIAQSTKETDKILAVFDKLEAGELTVDKIKDMDPDLYKKMFEPKPRQTVEEVPSVKPAKNPELLHLQYMAGVISGETYQLLSKRDLDDPQPEDFNP